MVFSDLDYLGYGGLISMFHNISQRQWAHPPPLQTTSSVIPNFQTMTYIFEHILEENLIGNLVEVKTCIRKTKKEVHRTLWKHMEEFKIWTYSV